MASRGSFTEAAEDRVHLWGL